jgi:Putative restriction endonuclease
MDVVFDKWNVFQTDLLFVSNEHASIITPAAVRGTPDLVMELLSPSNGYYDLTKKKELYERFGVKEYLIVDPMEHSIDILQIETARSNSHFPGATTVRLPRKYYRDLLWGLRNYLRDKRKTEFVDMHSPTTGNINIESRSSSIIG